MDDALQAEQDEIYALIPAFMEKVGDVIGKYSNDTCEIIVTVDVDRIDSNDNAPVLTVIK